MLELPQKTLSNIKNILLRQQKEVKERIESINKEDPIMTQNVPEAPESGTDSWMAEVHGRMTTIKNDLADLSKRIGDSLSKLRKGTYGKCEKCGKAIEPERLKALPTATVCISCSKKSPSKKV
ncbi:MAG: TraR/DksA C4-type zinc finger protein [Candidatus Daviesbacteria bacterium]